MDNTHNTKPSETAKVEIDVDSYKQFWSQYLKPSALALMPEIFNDGGWSYRLTKADFRLFKGTALISALGRISAGEGLPEDTLLVNAMRESGIHCVWAPNMEGGRVEPHFLFKPVDEQVWDSRYQRLFQLLDK